MSDENRTIAVLAHKALRNGPSSPLIRFFREFEPFFREELKPIFIFLESIYRSIIRYGLLQGYDEKKIMLVRPGSQGGVVEITALVSEIDQPIDRVIYFMDPQDPTSIFPENIALKRECVVKEIPFLSTYASAREWATLEWYNNRALKSDRFDGFDVPQGSELVKKREKDLLNKQCIALIAHDSKKLIMLEFADGYRQLINEFEKRIATGTTGELLNGQQPERLVQGTWKELKIREALYQENKIEVPPSLTHDLEEMREIKHILKRFKDDSWVLPLHSGPKGGDVLVAEEVRKGSCHRAIFFEDPLVSREHEADIQLLERTARIKEKTIPCYHDRKSAEEWMQNLKEYLEKNENEQDQYILPITLVQAFRYLFGGIDLVLSDNKWSRRNLDFEFSGKKSGPYSKKLWNSILSRASLYIIGLINTVAIKNLELGKKCHVGITWGFSMFELVEMIEAIKNDVLKESPINWVYPPRDFLLKEYFNQPSANFVPMIGFVGTPNPKAEARYNANELQEIFSCTETSYGTRLDQCAFIEKDKFEKVKPSRNPWEELDIAIFTCDEVKYQFGREAKAPVPNHLFEEMQDRAVGEVGGMYLLPNGKEAVSDEYKRYGADFNQIKNVSKKGGAVLLAGVFENRVKPTLAALKGGLVSTLVTDYKFAKGILKLHLTGKMPKFDQN